MLPYVAAVFQYCRKISKEMGKSYIDYHFGMPIYNIFDADITEFVLNDANLLSKGRIYDFMKPVLSNGLLTAACMISDTFVNLMWKS